MQQLTGWLRVARSTGDGGKSVRTANEKMRRKERGKMLFEAVRLQSGGSSEGKPETEKGGQRFLHLWVS